MSLKSMREAKRTEVMNQIMAALTAAGEDIGASASNEFNMPVVLADGSEDFVVVKISIPTGTRDGDAYDGYAMRTDYAMKCEEKLAKAAEAAAKKAKKIEKDTKMREARARVAKKA